MNRYISSLLFFISILVMVQCKNQKEIIEYNIPFTLDTLGRKYIMYELETGKALYKDHCSKCHGIFNKAREGVPDFSVVEINSLFEARLNLAIFRDPISHNITRRMLPEEVNQIMGFIERYRRKKTN